MSRVIGRLCGDSPGGGGRYGSEGAERGCVTGDDSICDI